MTHTPVIAALQDPRAAASWSAPDWEMLIRQGRSANLLPRLAALMDDLDLLERVAPGPRAHLLAARVVARAQADAVQRELVYIAKALASTGVDIILLKGAAYLLANLPPAPGRVFSDVDILVPRESLAKVESALMLHGWAGSHHDRYDQRYYREWMHELPPMRHVSRQTVVDVHHALVPPSARFKPDSAKVLQAALGLPGHARLKVLAPTDMVLHAAAHLFLNEELTHGLRDLVDLDALLRYFAPKDGFWSGLCARARELDLQAPLHYALRYSSRMLGTPVPEEALKSFSMPRWRGRMLDALYLRALQPDHPAAADHLTPLARRMLYLRGHWLRLPPGLLAYHLAVKAMRWHADPATDRPR